MVWTGAPDAGFLEKAESETILCKSTELCHTLLLIYSVVTDLPGTGVEPGRGLFTPCKRREQRRSQNFKEQPFFPYFVKMTKDWSGYSPAFAKDVEIKERFVSDQK